MDKSTSLSNFKSIYKFNKIDNFSFTIFTLQYVTVLLYLFYLGLTHAAWGAVLIISLFIYFSISKRFNLSIKSITAVVVMTAYYTFCYVLYGKSLNFVILNFITPIVLLTMIRNTKLLYYYLLLIISIIATTFYFDFFGYDYGNAIYYHQNISDQLFYFIFIMTSLFIIVLLTARTRGVSYIINDLKSKNIELEESRIELKKLQVNKESFFAIMSHEIRTPLNAIKGISDILKNNVESDEKQNLFELMDYSANHLLALVNNILDFTKLNDGAFSLQYSEFNLTNSLYSLFKMNERVALEKGLKFEIKISKNIPTYVYGDKNRINQIVLNLLNNAIEYTTEGSVKMHVNGTLSHSKENVFLLEIKVKDTGKGIDKTLGEKLFQKYASSNTSKNSVGLGLTISKGLIDLMNGTISYKSKMNKGTTFHISIPLPVIENATADFENNGLNFDEVKMSILLVDDNKINILVLQKQLVNKIKNCIITVAYDGLEALNLIKNNHYDIVLMDIIMPVMDGITASQHVRNLSDEHKKNIPIIALTANVGEKEIIASQNAGMNDFITKPFEINALLKIIFDNIKS